MLNKLLKYDFKIFFKNIIPIYLITILLALLNRLFNFLGDEIYIFKYPGGFITFACFALLIGGPIVAFIISIIKYYSSMTKDEAYLTHTLPVKKSKIIISKLIVSFVLMISSLAVSILGLMIAVNLNYNAIFDFIKLISKELGTLFIILLLVAAIVGYVSNILTIYLSIALGQKCNGNKKVYSIIFGIVIYNVSQIVSTLLLFIPAIFNKSYMQKFTEEVPTISFLNGFMIYAIIITVAITGIFYIFTVKIMEKKLNLD